MDDNSGKEGEDKSASFMRKLRELNKKRKKFYEKEGQKKLDVIKENDESEESEPDVNKNNTIKEEENESDTDKKGINEEEEINTNKNKSVYIKLQKVDPIKNIDNTFQNENDKGDNFIEDKNNNLNSFVEFVNEEAPIEENTNKRVLRSGRKKNKKVNEENENIVPEKVPIEENTNKEEVIENFENEEAPIEENTNKRVQRSGRRKNKKENENTSNQLQNNNLEKPLLSKSHLDNQLKNELVEASIENSKDPKKNKKQDSISLENSLLSKPLLNNQEKSPIKEEIPNIEVTPKNDNNSNLDSKTSPRINEKEKSENNSKDNILNSESQEDNNNETFANTIINEKGEPIEINEEAVMDKFTELVEKNNTTNVDEIARDLNISKDEAIKRLREFEKESGTYGILGDDGEYFSLDAQELELIDKLYFSKNKKNKGRNKEMIQLYNSLIDDSQEPNLHYD